MRIQPKFEWLLNVAFFFLLSVLVALACFWCQFIWAQAIMGLIFYGGIGYIAFTVWRK